MSLQRLTKFRRDLHKIPETGLILPKTQAYVIQALQALPCTLYSPTTYSVCAYFDAGNETTLAYRSDMDALPVQEKTSHDFCSLHEGAMHACGHDGHMAMLLEFAYEVAEYYKELPHNILLIFQPGEETPGGAQPICETGILDTYHVTHIYGSHVWPMLPAGVIGTRKGEFMARASEIDITIYGKSVHTAKYKEGIDALEAGTDLLTQLYQMEKNEIEPDVYRLLRFGHFESGTTRNVVSSHTKLGGTLRAFQDDVYWYMRKRVMEIVADIEQTYHVTTDVRIADGYPAVINDAALYDHVKQFITDIQIQDQTYPEMIAEDFAFYQQYVPGLFFFIGTGTKIPLHANTFDFDEAALMSGVNLYKHLSRLPYYHKYYKNQASI